MFILGNTETFVSYGISPNYKPYENTTLYSTSPTETIQNSLNYPTSVSFKPWYAPWNNGRNKYYCYLDNHLQRRCIWTCDNNNDKTKSCQTLEQKCC
tara:strand:+ start:163 stop:453 length:291 start_codon:yes stop_codon:yes gene_type:complete